MPSDSLSFHYLFVPRRGPTVLRRDVNVLVVERKKGVLGDTNLVWARFLPNPTDAPTTKLGEVFSDYDPTGKLVLLFRALGSPRIVGVLRAAGWPIEK